MKGLAGLGAFAGGFGQGMERGQRLTLNDMAIKRQQREDKDADALKADMDEANEAARAYLRGLQPQQQSAPERYLTLGGTDTSMPDQTALDSMPQAQPTQPSRAQLLRAAETRTNHLFGKGRVKEGMELWMRDEPVRAAMRQEAAAKGMAVYKTTGDPTELIRGVYENVDDGWDVQDVKPIEGPNGPAFAITRRNQRTGKTAESKVDGKQIEGFMALLADPKEAARYALREKLAVFEANLDRETAGQKHNLSLSLEGFKSGLRKEEDAENNASRERVAGVRAGATVTAAQIRGASKGGGGTANNVARTVTNADGTRTIIFRDGSNKTLVDDNGKPIRGIEAERLLQGLTKEIGKTIEGSLATPEANRARADNMLPKPAPAANRLRLDAQGNLIK